MFPEGFVQLLEALGIDPAKDGDVYHEARRSTGWHYYGGWFHFVGSLEVTGDFAPVDFGGGFTGYMCRSYAPSLEALKGLPLVQLEFRAESVPWMLDEEEPT